MDTMQNIWKLNINIHSDGERSEQDRTNGTAPTHQNAFHALGRLIQYQIN